MKKLESKVKFYRKIKEADPDKCWEWQGKMGTAYGIFIHDGKTISAHRASYIIHKGEIKKGKYICHKCNNKKCVNPNHLYEGTASTNSRDMQKDKREEKIKKLKEELKFLMSFDRKYLMRESCVNP